MIPPVPILIRLPIGCALMLVALAFGSAANWVVPEMEDKQRCR